jgi:hypothetical protein
MDSLQKGVSRTQGRSRHLAVGGCLTSLLGGAARQLLLFKLL